MRRCELDKSDFEQRPGAGFCEHAHEILTSMKSEILLGQVTNYW